MPAARMPARRPRKAVQALHDEHPAGDQRGVGSGHDDGALVGVGQDVGDVEHVLGFEPEVELLDDGLGEQVDQGRRVGQRGDGNAADEHGRDQRHGGDVGRTSDATRRRWTLTTTRSPVLSVAECTWAMEAEAIGVRSKETNTSAQRPSQVLLDRAPDHRERLGRAPGRGAAGTRPTSSSGNMPSPAEMIWPSLM